MNANRQLKENVDALLHAQHQSRKDLAQWCHMSESWISKIYKEERRGFSIKLLDRIADFFGLTTYQLFQPGIAKLSERRIGERRHGHERRIGHQERLVMALGEHVGAHRPPRGKAGLHVAATSPFAEELRRLAERYNRDASAVIARFESGGQARTARVAEPEASARRRVRRRRDVDKPPEE